MALTTTAAADSGDRSVAVVTTAETASGLLATLSLVARMALTTAAAPSGFCATATAVIAVTA